MLKDSTCRHIFTGCEKPNTIKNPFTDEILTVPCGKCKSCVQRKANKYSTLCQLERAFESYDICRQYGKPS